VGNAESIGLALPVGDGRRETLTDNECVSMGELLWDDVEVEECECEEW
jgi:hypothetical protein